MEIKHTAMDGTLESADIQVTITNNIHPGNQIDLQSQVQKRFGKDIEKSIKQQLKRYNLENVLVKAVDQGALPCTITARTITAIERALQ